MADVGLIIPQDGGDGEDETVGDSVRPLMNMEEESRSGRGSKSGGAKHSCRSSFSPPSKAHVLVHKKMRSEALEHLQKIRIILHRLLKRSILKTFKNQYLLRNILSKTCKLVECMLVPA